MIDHDIAELYGVEPKRLNEQVKRNIERFSEEFCFQLNYEEFKNWKSQNFDAYAKFESFLAQANKEIVLIDNYVDLSVLQRLSKKQNGVDVKINTSPNPL